LRRLSGRGALPWLFMLPEEVGEMSEKTICAVSVASLAIGSILMLIAGLGFTSSKAAIPAGAVCFIASVLIGRVFGKKRTNP